MSSLIRCYFVVGTQNWNIMSLSPGSIFRFVLSATKNAKWRWTRVSFSITNDSPAISYLSKLHNIVHYKHSTARNETIEEFQE